MKIILTNEERKKFQKYVDHINEKTGLHRTLDELINEIGNNQKDLWLSFSYKRFCEASDSLLPDTVINRNHVYQDYISTEEYKSELDFYKSLDWFMILIQCGREATEDKVESFLSKYQDKWEEAFSKIGISTAHWTPFFNSMSFDEVFEQVIKPQCGNSVKLFRIKEENHSILLDFNGEEFQDWLETHSKRLT